MSIKATAKDAEFGGVQIQLTARFDFSPAEAYLLARELCFAANSVRERNGWKHVDGPFVVVRARKITDHERAARAASSTIPTPASGYTGCSCQGDYDNKCIVHGGDEPDKAE